jgi:hypothetical protein
MNFYVVFYDISSIYLVLQCIGCFYSVMYVLQFCSGVIMHITELVYVFLYSYLLYAPVYPVPMRCLFMFSYVYFFQFFSVLIMQKSATVYAYSFSFLR